MGITEDDDGSTSESVIYNGSMRVDMARADWLEMSGPARPIEMNKLMAQLKAGRRAPWATPESSQIGEYRWENE